ncbi:MAG: nitroreductase, partial [Lysinibacillus sp.]
IINDAIWAPNHGNREPWRLIVAAGDQLDAALSIIRDVAVPKWKDLSDEDLAKQMAKFTSAGAYVFVVMPEDRRQKERLEDFAAASSFLQNMQLLAWDNGIGSCWKTPPFLENPNFNNALGVQPGERVIAMLQLGYFDEAPKGKARKTADQIVTFLGQ